MNDMSMKAKIRNIPLKKSEIKKAFDEISNVEMEDDIQFIFDNIMPIREDDEYGGYRLSFKAVFENAIEKIEEVLDSIEGVK